MNPNEDVAHAESVGFCILENGTLCGRRKLVDTRGYTYNIRYEKDSRTYWWCSVRNKTLHCKATVIQQGEIFKFGSKEHIHDPKPVSKVKKRRKPVRSCKTTDVIEDKEECLELEEEAGHSAYRQVHRVGIQKLKFKEKRKFVRESLDIKFRIIDEGTRCGRRKLVDNQGYTYNIKCHKNNVTYWWCAVRNKTVHCRAAVSQRGDKFKIGKVEHCHEAVFKPKKKSTITEDTPISSVTDLDIDEDFEIPGESLTFHVVDGASKNRRVILVDSDGYSYKMKRQKDDQAYWICVVQNKNQRCSASVSQKGDKFRLGKMPHCHKPASTTKREEEYEESQNSNAYKFEEVLVECLDLKILGGKDVNQAHYGQPINQPQQNCKPTEQIKHGSLINTEYIPAHFLQKDICVGHERHLVLAFKEQMDLLSKTQVWYLDTAVRIVCEPFVQLFTIHTCVQSAEEIRHVPLVYILMSRCQSEDYKKVFQAILDDMPQPVVVNSFVASVDENMWEAVESTFPNRRLQGCAFHWGKAVWQKADELGLKTEYGKKDGNFEFINKVLALPFLPHEHMGLAFRFLWDSARGFNRLQALMEYIDITWISNSSWNLSSWSMFMQPIRTRSDVESWQCNVPLENEKPSFYRLLWQLIQEAKQIPLQVRTVCDEKLTSYQKSNIGSLQNHIFDLWATYSTGTMNTNLFLEKIGLLYCFEITTS